MLHNLWQRRSKYGSNFGQNYIFANSFTNWGHFKLTLGQYFYIHAINQIWLLWTKFGLKKVQIWVQMWAKITFWQYLNQSWQFLAETRSVFVFIWYASENEDMLLNLCETSFVYYKHRAVFIGPNREDL